jgi:hypothetical protein
MEVHTAKLRRSSKPLVPYEEGDQTSYKPQISSKMKYECSEPKVSHVGLSEGSSDPLYRQQEHCVKEMYDALGTMYQSVKVSRNMLLRNKLITTHMCKTHTIASYLMKLVELRDQLGAVADKDKDDELVYPVFLLSGWNNSIAFLWGMSEWKYHSHYSSP